MTELMFSRWNGLKICGKIDLKVKNNLYGLEFLDLAQN